VLELLTIADETCWVLNSSQEDVIATGEMPARFMFTANVTLIGENRGRSLCIEIDESVAIVLPKRRTPEPGLTIRSLSHYLALVQASEVRAKWVRPFMGASDRPRRLNLLVVPWPFELSPNQFRSVRFAGEQMSNMPSCYGFFTVDQRPDRLRGRNRMERRRTS
jgi:hypothetical protein